MVWNIAAVILHDRIMKHWEKVHIEMTFPLNFWLENPRSCRWNRFSFQSIKNQSRPMSSLLHTEYIIALFVGFVSIDQVFTFFFSLTVLCFKFSYTVLDAKTSSWIVSIQQIFDCWISLLKLDPQRRWQICCCFLWEN